MRHLLPCPPCGRQGRPGEGDLAGFIERPRGSAPRERDHRGGDHPVPSRTRQLSPPSPRVLQRKAAGGQGVALAEGAFLSAPFERRPPTGRRSLFPGRARGGAPADAGGVRRMRRERPAGDVAPCGPFLRFGVLPCVAGPPTSAFTGSGCGPSCVRVGCCRKAHGSLKNQRIHGGYLQVYSAYRS